MSLVDSAAIYRTRSPLTMASAILVVFWLLASVAIALAGLSFFIAPKLPQFIQDLLLYGKARGKRSQWSVIQLIEVPKSWFVHFYAVGIAVNGYAIYIVVSAYFWQQKPPDVMVLALKFIHQGQEPGTPSIGAVPACMLITLMFMQNVRRFLECNTVSVYSKSTMNLAHFLLGIILYSTFHLAVLAQAPSLLTYTDVREEPPHWLYLVAMALFTWASWHQNRAHVILGELRKNKQGKVTSYQHHIPSGGWFDLVSCPHYFMETLIYTAMGLVAGPSHFTLWSLIVFVYVNQLVAAQITHRWYKANFPKYPKERTSLIPYLI